MSITTLGDFLYWAEESFIEADLFFGHGTDNAWDEALALARFVLQLNAVVDVSEAERRLTATDIETLTLLVEKRIKDRIPVPYLSHEAWFAGLKFYVDERVIIPRSPFGELIEKKFQPWLAERPAYRILDLCTGSACIAIAIAYAFPEAQVDAVDISSEALAVAEKNVKLHNLENRVKLIQSDLFNACEGNVYDIIISNPPYVDHQDIEDLPREYQWEPKLALAAGEDGLEIARRILKEAPRFLNRHGILVVELGNSAEAMIDNYPKTPFIWLDFERGGQGVFLLNGEDKECWQVF